MPILGTVIHELPLSTQGNIQKLVDEGVYDLITVDVAAPITYTFKSDGKTIGVFHTTLGDHEGLPYPQFALVQQAHIMAIELFNRYTNQATQLAAEAQAKRVSNDDD